MTSLPPAQRSKTPAEFIRAHGLSYSTWKRLKRAGDIPRLTKITEHKSIITLENERAWIEARTTGGPEPKPFPDGE